jgi:hypothetical protein
MDLTQISMEYMKEEEQKNVYMFLSFSWAFIADVDLNSEKLRCMGPSRFTLWGLFRIMILNHYQCYFGFNGQYIHSNEKLDSEVDFQAVEEE